MFPHRLLILVNFNRNLSQLRHKPGIYSFFHCQLPFSLFFIVIQSLKSSSTITPGVIPPLYIHADTRDTQRAPLLEQNIMIGQNYQNFKMDGGAPKLGQTSPQPQKVTEKPPNL